MPTARDRIFLDMLFWIKVKHLRFIDTNFFLVLFIEKQAEGMKNETKFSRRKQPLLPVFEFFVMYIIYLKTGSIN